MDNLNILEYDIPLAPGETAAGVISDAEQDRVTLRPHQTHSCNVAIIKSDGEIPLLEDTDAIISFRPGLPIGIRTADCVPILLYAPDIKGVAAIHAGWRGSIGGILTRTISILKEHGADPTLIRAAFGPSICGKCYEFSPELAEEFRDAGFGVCILGERNLDLERVNTLRMTQEGLLPQNILHSHLCTFESPLLPSWRRQPTDRRLLTRVTLL